MELGGILMGHRRSFSKYSVWVGGGGPLQELWDLVGGGGNFRAGIRMQKIYTEVCD